jgi:uncharacterized protein YbaR (Trm112 family)/SAM-dependent methyltransferase
MHGLRELLVCPSCHGLLAWSANEIRCQRCMRRFAIVDGVPVLLTDEVASKHDELEHVRTNHTSQQASFFDREEAAEFETIRPHGAPYLYRWLLEEKFRRGVAGLGPILEARGATALVVCGGSGMDAQFLSLAGAQVITSDISIGAARRASDRGRRHGLSLVSIVADAEKLPFCDKAMDLVYVHDGLHHLAEPMVALVEMMRVSADAVSINEPARAALTSGAVRLGLALEREHAGNLVVRLKPDEIRAVLRSADFRIVRLERYAMYYRHQPGRLVRLLSGRWSLRATKLALQLLNQVVGRAGNKLTIQAVRGPTVGSQTGAKLSAGRGTSSRP